MSEQHGNDLEDKIQTLRDQVASKTDFLEVVRLLRLDASTNLDAWENKSIDRYLEALGAWAECCQNYYKNCSIDVDANTPSWRLFTDMLIAARIYE